MDAAGSLGSRRREKWTRKRRTRRERRRGQGDTDGPVRSMLMLDATTRAVEQLCAGFRYDMPEGVGATRVPQVFFADDGCFGSNLEKGRLWAC